MRAGTSKAAVFALILGLAAPAQARDWFVRAGSDAGDGTIARPFGDPFQAMEKAEAGDRVHVTEGKYYGKIDSGLWTLTLKVELLGGYSTDFKERNPWTHLSELLWKKGSKVVAKDTRVEHGIQGADPTGSVIDGFVFDLRGVCNYNDSETGFNMMKPFTRRAIQVGYPITVRNSVFLNTSWMNIEVAPGSTIENNLIVNVVRAGITVRGGNKKGPPTQIKNNTIVASWDHKAPGTGGPQGIGIELDVPANIENNLLAFNDNYGIYVGNVGMDKLTLKDNVFFRNLFGNFKFFMEGRDVAIDDGSMDQFEDVGFKEQSGNVVMDPQISLDPKWLDLYSKRSAGTSGKVKMDDWNQMRRVLGLPLIATGGEAASNFAPPYDLKYALQLLSPKNPACKAGARAKSLEVKVDTSGAAASAGPAKSYEKVKPLDFIAKPGSFDGKSVEMTVAIGGTANPGDPLNVPEFKKDGWDATNLYDPDGEGKRALVLYKKGTSAARAVDDSIYNGPSYNGIGKPQRLFVVRGTAKEIKYQYGSPKPALVLEQFERVEAAAPTAARPQGRDWFVRAGSSGGDGSREKPFKDPYQALEKAEPGDSIHVAKGEYYGKLKCGRWKLNVRFLSLLGGYTSDFTARDPWKNPTLLVWPADSKTNGSGYTLEGDGDHTGTVIDGFVFDKKGLHKYAANGDALHKESDASEHIFIGSPDCVVRNNVFVNGGLGAVLLTTAMTLENNIFINHVWNVITVKRGDPRPIVIRNNTVLFSWHTFPGDLQYATGNGLEMWDQVQANVDNNAFQFIDINAIRGNAYAKDIELTRNTFSHNLGSNYMYNGLSVHDANLKQLCDLGFKKCGGNATLNCDFPIDKDWFEVYASRTATEKGKVTMDDWNEARRLLGLPMHASGGKKGEGFAPAYDWKKALDLFPRNAACKSGARRLTLPVQFAGAKAAEAGFTYEETTWEGLRENIKSVLNKRVAVKVALGSSASISTWPAGTGKEEWNAFQMVGPQGRAGSGSPKRFFVKKGTRHERTVNAAPALPNDGPPEKTYLIKGLVIEGGDIIVDAVEAAD